MASKTTFNPLAVANIPKHLHTGGVDLSTLGDGFIAIGETAKGSEILKPVSKKEFVQANAERLGSKSQAVKVYYQHLQRFTSAGTAAFTNAVTQGMRLAQTRKATSGRLNFTLFQPKGDTGSQVSLAKENAGLRAKLQALEARMLAAGVA